jgi:hypothetical protein
VRPGLFIVISVVFILLLAGRGCAEVTDGQDLAIGNAFPASELGLIQNPFSYMLEPPVLVSPANGTAFSHVPRAMTLAWRPVPGANSYRVEVAWSDGSSWTPLATATIPGQNTSFVTFEFVGDYAARWRVTAVGAWNSIHVESQPSAWWYFSWNTRQALPEPVLVSPGGGAVFSHTPRVTTLAWKPVPGATGYLLERGILMGTEWYPYPDIPLTGGMNASCTFDFGSQGHGRWRVTAVDGSAFGDSTSGWWQFSFMN